MQDSDQPQNSMIKRKTSLLAIMAVGTATTAFCYFVMLIFRYPGEGILTTEALPYFAFLAASVVLGMIVWSVIGVIPALAVGYLVRAVLRVATPALVSNAVATSAGLFVGAIVANVVYIEAFRQIGGATQMDILLLSLAPACGGMAGLFLSWRET